MDTSPTILALNRNPRNLELLTQFLGKRGLLVVGVTTLEEFARAVDEKPISVALVDITGFDSTIWEHCERLRARDIPFLILSPRQSAALQQEGLARGARGVLVKPLVSEELVRLINSMLK